MERELGLVRIRVGRLKEELDGVLAGGTEGRCFEETGTVSSVEDVAGGGPAIDMLELVLEADRPRFRPCRRGGGGGGSFELEGEGGTGKRSSSLIFSSDIDVHCSRFLVRVSDLS